MDGMDRLPSLGPRGEGWVAVQLVLLALIGVAGWRLGPDWSGTLRSISVVVGIVLMLAGGVEAALGMRHLGDALTPLPRPRDDAELVETGVYRLVRHPIYGGLIVASLGWGLVNASVVALALSGVLAAFFLLKSTREELWLTGHFPGYAAYRARTRRFIPWIG
jgi:protein-S-isoprenylcysteine O-methyltransferase Ste14